MQALGIWQIHDAKARLTELIKHTHVSPQAITVHGKRVAVVLSADGYDELTSTQPNLYEFLQQSPLRDIELNLDRDKSTYTRNIEL
ncbi:hypothetical protein RsTz2092_13990 [Deferribacterales bacterium RsTz2092]